MGCYAVRPYSVRRFMSENTPPQGRSLNTLQSNLGTPSVEDAPAHPPKTKSQIERVLRRVWRRIHFRFPWLVPSPYRSERDYLRDRDAKHNFASRVPADERLQQIAIWGVEIYGPAEIDKLHRGMKQLGWNDERLFGFNTNPGSWIDEQRTYGTEGSFNLGLIDRPGKSRFLSKARPAPLPDTVDYALGWIFQLSPSITAVIMCFVLREPACSAYQVEINLDRKTVHEPLDGGYRSYDVEHAKRRAVDAARVSTRTLVAKWFTVHLPGLFSLASDGNRLPTAELLTTDSHCLLDYEHRSLEPDWIRLTSPLGHREVWTLNSMEGIKLCWPEFDGDLRYHAIVNLRTARLTTEHLKHHGDPSDSVYISLVDDQIRGVLVHFAATAALREIVRRLRLAPSTLSPDTTTRRGTVKCLERIRLFFEQSVGVPAFTSELAAKSKTISSYSWDCEDFQASGWRPEDPPTKISEALRSRTHFLASRAQLLERESREHLEQLSGILSTRENIRTQARMELVTVGAAILSLASLVVAVMSVDRFATYVNQQVERFYKSK